MNQRIEKLSKQAELPITCEYSIPEEFVENFAELIIKECIWIAYNHMSLHKSSEQYKFTDSLDKIKEHFEIK